MFIDCDTLDSGCNGGLMEYAFTWLKQNGIMKEEDYLYTGNKGTFKAIFHLDIIFHESLYYCIIYLLTNLF